MTSAEAQTLLPAFLDFVKTLKGDEKGVAQTFLDPLFKALGHAGEKEAGHPLRVSRGEVGWSCWVSQTRGALISPSKRSSLRYPAQGPA